MLRFLHAADFHLDSPFAALGGEKAALRRQEQRKQLRELAALAEQADLVLLPGDLLDSARAYGETREALEEFFSALRVPVFIAPGNHDYYTLQCPYARMELPENVHVFTHGEPEAVPLPELGCTVWGAAFRSDWSGPLLRGFTAPAGGGLQLMVLHGEVTEGQSKYGPITEADLEASGLNYLALGHSHSCSGLRRSGRTWWAYPGCTLGRGFDETGEKGVLLGTLEGENCTLEFRPLSGRRYRDLEVDITGAESAEQAVLNVLSPEWREDILRVTLRGEWETKPETDSLTRTLDGCCWALTLRDETRLTRDIWKMADEDTLRGAFLRILRKQYEAAGEGEKRERITRAARYGLAALEDREDV